MNCPIIKLTKDLIKRKSITPCDKGCQELLIKRLDKIGFNIEQTNYDNTSNFLAYRGSIGKTLAFSGHTDVAPAGNYNSWNTPPFTPTIINKHLYGRGAADMKGSIAAMIIAAERFIKKNNNYKGKLAFIITSDEESKTVKGVVKLLKIIMNRNEHIDYCVIGEPSSQTKLGDIIKNGRRGSITANLTIFGVQGHVAYPHLAKNPIHNTITFLQNLINTKWDNGNKYFPPTTMQIVNIYTPKTANNIIPGELFIQFNLRFSNELNDQTIRNTITNMLAQHNIKYKIKWSLSGQPFLTKQSKLVTATLEAIQKITGNKAKLSTDGGTSDGRFIAQTGAQIIELGPINKTIHAVNECVNINDLKQLSLIYEQIMKLLLL
ncbi:Succinyl-diaminopimelate desuccinylase [Candidatus Providencia siddallii]|uniref:Succinyl-diaminopimelate desuccinylase n=1 Tax=Candidatus Providencia siddallii TaxID=1715285 RepID=A0A0M6W924_9GAMM|nr:Succinyl-diaminopimelate desuccinylase [Candidatus Providencia siddallii]